MMASLGKDQSPFTVTPGWPVRAMPLSVGGRAWRFGRAAERALVRLPFVGIARI
jgi:hypothetical protein